MMTRYNQLLCVIGLTFMVGCTDCSDMSDDDVTASTPLPDTTIPTETTEPSTPMGVCGDVTQAPTDDVPAPTDTDVPTWSSICDRDDLDSEYTVWDGDVTIKDLESLETYTLIKGSLDLGTANNQNSDNEIASLERVDLPELQVICGGVDVYQNNNLEHINLPQLNWVSSINVQDSDQLSHINLPQLRVSGTFFVYNSEAFQSIDLPELQTVYRSGVFNNGALQNINLPKLQTVHLYFTIEINGALQSVNLPKLQTVPNNFIVRQNYALQSIDLSELQTVHDNFIVRQNKALQSVNLPKLQTVHGDFIISSNRALANLNVSKLQTVEGSFTLSSSASALSSVDLPSLKTIGGFGYIGSHEGATSLNLPQLQSVGDSFTIIANNFICVDLSQLQTVGSDERTESILEEGVFVQTGLDFRGNTRTPANLVLPQLQTVDGDIAFSANFAIIAISMPQLQSIGHNLEFRDTLLSTIDMPQLQSVGGMFRFDENFNPAECNLGSYTNAQCP